MSCRRRAPQAPGRGATSRRPPPSPRGSSRRAASAAGRPRTPPARRWTATPRETSPPSSAASSRCASAPRRPPRRWRTPRRAPCACAAPRSPKFGFCAYPPLCFNCGDAVARQDLAPWAWGGGVGGRSTYPPSRKRGLNAPPRRPRVRGVGCTPRLRGAPLRPFSGGSGAFGAIVRLWPCQQPSSLSKKSPWHPAWGAAARPPLPWVKPPLAMARNTGRALKRALILANAVCLDRPWASA